MKTKPASIGTPWGASHSITEKAPGLDFVSTAGHGGYKLAPALWAELVAKFPAFKSWAGDFWLEEDCDAVFAVLAFPQHFTERDIFHAVRMARCYPSKNFESVRVWLATTPEGRALQATHDVQAVALALLWEVGSMHTQGKAWHVHCTQPGGKSVWRVFPEYPAQTFYTDAELEAVSTPEPAREPVVVAVVVSFDAGEPIHSDADPGL